MPSLIDTHSHIYVGRFASDIDEVIERARAEGVEHIIVPVTNPTEHEAAFALEERFPEVVKVALGVHPHHAHEVSDEDLDEIERLASNGRAIAIGEIGLDYYYEYAPKQRQHEVFRRQLRIARKLDLPAAVHNRESDDDLLRIIEEEQDGSLRFQLHCFSSNNEILARAIELGGMVSFTGNITYNKSALDDVVRAVPDDRFMIETDAPYLTPVPYRGKRNEPGYVGLVAAKIAELRGETIDAIKQMTTTNARRFFRLALGIIALVALCGASALAQSGPAPVRPVDTTAPLPFDRIFGFGGHIASSTYISGSTTEANALGYGWWLTGTPLASLNIDWLQIDLAYTHVEVPGAENDSTFNAVKRQVGDTFLAAPPNIHNTFDISVRATANPRKIITFFATLGATYFDNTFGIDRYLIEHGDTTLKDFKENAWGLSGSLGVSLNLVTPYGTIAPTAEWRVAKISGERTLPKRKQEFFVSQPRLGILIYPNFRKLFQ